MRQLVKVMVAVAVAAAGWAAVAGPAYAGGPTSVLVVDLNSRRAAGIHYTDPAYDRLVAAVDAYGSAARPADPPTEVTTGMEPDVRLTWLIHDQQVWRHDRIFFVGADTWIQTVSTEGDLGADPYADTGIWHRPADGTALRAELRRLDVAAVPADPTPTTAPARADAGSASGSSGVAVAGAGLAGLVVGAGGVLVGRRRVRGERIVLEG